MARIFRCSAGRVRPRVFRSALAGLAFVGALSMTMPGSALGFDCATQKLQSMGTKEYHATFKGVETKIATVNESLCTGSQGVFSSSWVGLVGINESDVLHLNIYQIGIDECKNSECLPGTPNNTTYFFYAWGRMAGPCGATPIGPAPILIPGTPSGLRTYNVSFASGPIEPRYNAKIDGAIKDWRPQADLTTCWEGIDGAHMANESLNTATQQGGPTSNYQDWQDPKWYNGGTWSTISRPPGTICDSPPSPARRCQWSTVTPNTWRSWDTRF